MTKDIYEVGDTYVPWQWQLRSVRPAPQAERSGRQVRLSRRSRPSLAGRRRDAPGSEEQRRLARFLKDNRIDKGVQLNDTYEIDSLSDFVGEFANAGVDTVLSTVVHTLGDNFENLTLIGALNGQKRS